MGRKRLRNLMIMVLSVSLVTGAMLAGGCTEKEEETKGQKVTFEQLFSNLEQYNGEYIALEGFYFSGFEVTVLSENLQYSGYAEGHLIPQGRMVWIEGGIPKVVYERLYQQQMMGPAERYGKMMVEGKFEFGGEYGHLGGYSYHIIPSDVELLPWSPEVPEEGAEFRPESECPTSEDVPEDVQIILDITPQQAFDLIQENQDNPDFIIIDVQAPKHFAGGHIENAINIDYFSETFQNELDTLDKNKTYLVYYTCHCGDVDTKTLRLMKELNFREAYNISGGLVRWKSEGFPTVK